MVRDALLRIRERNRSPTTLHADTDDAATRWGAPPIEEPDHDGYGDTPDEGETAELDELARLATAPASSG